MLLVLLACDGPVDDPSPQPPPLGMVLADDGQLYAGVARVDITPEIVETYTDLNGNHSFDGCDTDPGATRAGCDEPYDDVDGDNHFDGIWIAGFQSKRAALGVHDPVTVSAVVLSLDGEYVILAAIDAIGLLENRTRDLRDLLEAEGVDRDRVLVSSSHAHTAPDTVGIWGMEEDLKTGIYPPYQESIVPALQDAITLAAGSMVAVTPTQGLARTSDDPTLNGTPFDGTNPDPTVIGGINDIRDPLIEGDRVWALALDGPDGRVATLFSASGHPEVSGSDHSLLSADYVGYARDFLERRAGGLAVFYSGALGGMQSALGSTLPAVDDDGGRVLDAKGAPTWVQGVDPASDWELARTWGILVGLAAESALTDTQPWTSLRVRSQPYLIPVDNISFKLAFQIGILDTPVEYVVQDSTCPGYGVDDDNFGCVPGASWQVELGPSTLASVPGELFPELFYGVPDEPAMVDASLRPGDRRWVQFDADCAAVAWEECVSRETLGDCDCLKHHAAPYRISDAHPVPIAELLPGTYAVPLGITNAYCGYIVPTPDFSTYVSVLTEDGDHYEETNSCSQSFGDLVLDAFVQLNGG